MEKLVRLKDVTPRGNPFDILPCYVPRNVIDISTQTCTMKELKAYRIDTRFAILNAGCLTAENVRDPLRLQGILRIKEA